MSLVINTNSIATTATRNLATNSANLSRSLARLSSGSKIVIPSDDAGGLAVSTKLNAALNRNVRAQQNVQNSLSFLQVQDGALKVATSVLDRMSELKTMSLDPTKNASDLENYNTEFKQLQTQLSSIYGESFNGISVFDDSTNLSAYTTEDGATSVDLTRNGLFDEISTVNATQKIITSAAWGTGTTGVFANDGDSITLQFDTASGKSASVILGTGDANDAGASTINAQTIDGAIKAINDALALQNISTVSASESADGKLIINTSETVDITETDETDTNNLLGLAVNGAGATTYNGVAKTNSYNNLAAYVTGDVVTGTTSGGSNVSYLISAAAGWAASQDLTFDEFAASGSTTRLDNSSDPGVTVVTGATAVGTVGYSDTDGRYYLSKGATDTWATVTANGDVTNKQEWLALGGSVPSLQDYSAFDTSNAYSEDDIVSHDGSLYVATVDIASGQGNPITNAGATTGWLKLNVAISGSNNLLDQDKDISDFNTSDFTSFIQTAATARAQNGAEMQRLNWSDEMLKTNNTNLEAAHSRLADVDIATESTQFAKNNILVQSAAAMLAQANNLPSVALQLLQ
jgi:flagellin-like hook-associated protein FlgL